MSLNMWSIRTLRRGVPISLRFLLLTGADLLNAVQREMKKDQSFTSARLNITVIQLTPKGSLVCMDWGYDICEFIFKASGVYTTIVCIDDISRGIRAELIEFWCLKSWRREELADLGDAMCAALGRVISNSCRFYHSCYGSLPQSEFCQGPSRSDRFCTCGVGMTKIVRLSVSKSIGQALSQTLFWR
jgi:hypothetical protein